MAIWMDMTNSLYAWQGGVVGIVRAELEIAKHIHRNDPNVRFSMFDGYKFIEIAPEQLNWLWESENVGDAYIEAMGRKQQAPAVATVQEQSLTVEYPRLADAYQFSNSRMLRLFRGLDLWVETVPNSLKKPLRGTGKIVSIPLKKLSAARAKHQERKRLKQVVPNEQEYRDISFSYPYQDGDILFSCGWFASGKEWAFSRIKYELKKFTLIYLVYDIILMLPETKHFYDPQGCQGFLDYFKWLSFHCDYIFYGGETAKIDSQKYQKEHDFPVPEGFPIKFGSDILKSVGDDHIEQVLGKYNIASEYLLMVGSLDQRKNYNTVYRAYTILVDQYGADEVPDLVIVGKGDAYAELLACIQTDPRTKDKIKIISPSDQELDSLYKNCLFALLASCYEGWSLTLPEALGYHKFCIVSDVAPLREVGEGFVEFVDTYDSFAWAEQIRRYTKDRKLLKAKEEFLRKKWHTVTWAECGKQVLDNLKSIEKTEESKKEKPVLYLDITTTWLVAHHGGNLGGILRAEIMLFYHLYKMFDNVKFFAWGEEYGFQPIYVSQLMKILSSDHPADEFYASRDSIGYLNDYTKVQARQLQQMLQEKANKASAFWYLCSVIPQKYQKRFIQYGLKKKEDITQEIKAEMPKLELPFKKGDIVFSAGTGHGWTTDNELLEAKKRIGFKYSQLIYDFTPILIPQTHQKETVRTYPQFLSFASNTDLILYGGENAQKDGIAYQKKNQLPVPASAAIKFGSNLACYDEREEDEVKDMLKHMSIKGPFILVVGTCEARKNHETLYRAYLRMLEMSDDVPQMVFAGHPGWNATNFFYSMWNDERVKDKILTFAPSDEQLDLLYKKCEFTLLASLYEGWSLTLPESFQYGKFCLCCDNPALRETGRDLVEYIHAWDEVKWAERIMHYYTHKDVLKAAEKRIHDEWKLISWKDCAQQVAEVLTSKMEECNENKN